MYPPHYSDVSEDYTECLAECSSETVYLSGVCIVSNISVYNPELST